MASKADGISSLVDAFVEGKDVEAIAFSEEDDIQPDSNPTGSQLSPEPDADILEESDPEMDFFLEPLAEEAGKPDTDNPEESASEDDTADPQDVEDPSVESIEEIFVTDHRGRRKVKVDWSDKDKLKKHIQKAYGMRKFQAERDQYKERLEAVEAKNSENSEVIDSINEAYESGGLAAVADLIEGEGAWEAAMQKHIDLQEWKRGATESEIEAYNTREENARLQKQIEAQNKANEKFMQKVESEKDEAAAESLKSQTFPSFDKYRFEGKLKSPKEELQLDKMLWRNAKADLMELLEEGEDLTPCIIEKTFKQNYALLRRSENRRASSKAAATLKKKKQEAIENVQTQVMNGYKETGKDKEFKSLLDKGDIGGILSGFAKWE